MRGREFLLINNMVDRTGGAQDEMFFSCSHGPTEHNMNPYLHYIM